MKGFSSKRIALKLDVIGPENICRRIRASFILEILLAGAVKGLINSSHNDYCWSCWPLESEHNLLFVHEFSWPAMLPSLLTFIWGTGMQCRLIFKPAVFKSKSNQRTLRDESRNNHLKRTAHVSVRYVGMVRCQCRKNGKRRCSSRKWTTVNMTPCPHTVYLPRC